MMHEKAMSIHAALGKMLPRVSAEDAETLRICRRNIAELAEQATELENRLIPDLPVTTVALPAEGAM